MPYFVALLCFIIYICSLGGLRLIPIGVLVADPPVTAQTVRITHSTQLKQIAIEAGHLL
jgi:hypothetical protein